jgi:RNA polymerase sigma-70 factor, ECF subfamily
MDEFDAVKATQAGDRTAFDILISQYYKSIYRFTYHFTGSSQDADDICQETFLRAFEEITKLQNGKCFKGWIFMIASNLSRRYIRDSKSRKKLVEQTAVESSSELYGNNDNQPFESLSSKEKAQIIQKQLLKIPEQMRLATVLVHIEDFSQKEAAELLNCSEATISRDLTIAMTLMRSKLQNLV